MTLNLSINLACKNYKQSGFQVMTKTKYLVILISILFFNSKIYSQEQAVGLLLNEFMASNLTTIVDPDSNKYSDWIEIFNASDSSINLSGYYLTDDLLDKTKWKIDTQLIIEPDSFVVFWADGFNNGVHTNFKLSQSGESIGLYSSELALVDSIIYSEQTTDKSFGRIANNKWTVFVNPTPGAINDFQGIEIPSPIFSLTGGFYDEAQVLEISSTLDSVEIFYTTDGSVPTVNDSLYVAPLSILETSVIRAKSFIGLVTSSSTITNTYFINEETVLPTISIVTDPEGLFSDTSGMYVSGTNGISGLCSSTPKNWNQDWERPISIEFYEQDKSLGFKSEAGIKISGGCSRLYNQKSLAIYFREKYGANKLNYQLFPYKQIHQFNNFILRSGAQDWWRTMFREGMAHTVLKFGMDIDYQEYRPSIVFINGEYWGIHNIREKLNEHYVKDNHNADPKNIDLIELSKYVKVNYGDKLSYNNLIDFVSTKDMTNSENYDSLKKLIEVDEYINYQIAEIYCANGDWPGNNTKLWRPRTAEGKWRWMIYDLDFTFGGNAEGQPSSNTLEQATDTNGPDWPNPPSSTLLFRMLLNNKDFKDEFIQRFAVHMNTTFDILKVVNIIDSLQANIAPEIPRHKERWPKSLSFGSWANSVEIMRDFARLRPIRVSQHFREKFDLSGMASLTINNSNIDGGYVVAHTVKITENNFKMTLFKDVPVKLTAEALPGYKFVGWSGVTDSQLKSVSLTLTRNSEITAIFEEDKLQTTGVVINEINYNSASNLNVGDWIELFNNTENRVDVSGWIFNDGGDEDGFIFPDSSFIEAREYLVLCGDITQFSKYFPSVNNIIGNFSFKLSNGGEFIVLQNNQYVIIDSLTYNDKLPWATEADGSGSTLELINPNMDNSLAENWAASSNHGTPGRINNVYTKVEKRLNEVSPNEYLLQQNYPNPFNPTTTIKYGLPTQSSVRIVIYNMLGEIIEVLVDDVKSAGYYEHNWNASNFASGIYLYHIYINAINGSENYSNVKKMILIR